MFQKISPGIFAFISGNEGSNCFLIQGEKETALIDSSTAENKEAIISGLNRLDLKPHGISLILHTHGHADHFGCDYFFKNAKIAMHGADAKQISQGNSLFACTQFFPEAKLPKISLPLRGNQEIDLGGLHLRVIHTPGHTAGSVCFFLSQEKALFSGDTLFAEGFGRTDLQSSSAQKMLDSLKKLQKTPFKALFPGHGPILLGEEQTAEALKEIVETAAANSFL